MITARWDDLYLWEGSMRTRVLSEVLSGTLQVRLQVYNYVAFMANRRPSSITTRPWGSAITLAASAK